MFVRLTAWAPRIRRWLSRSEWAVRLLGLPRETERPGEPGLVLIQIDGLSRRQLERGMAEGRAPFLRRLLTAEHYRTVTLYSGMPSSTPAVQGELFYGARCAAPAFGFRSSRTGQVVRMVSPEAAEEVERRIAQDAEGLLAGGSAYCDIYSGGAAETHFCARNLGWGGFMRSARLSRLVLMATWHFASLLRAAALTVIEAAIALYGFARGALSGHDLREELWFIPARVAVVVLLRELAVIGACVDVTRGLPVVHLNLLGYDEHAHRRGPESAFAHWSLRGVDDAVRRVWMAAHRSAARRYDVWVYSDHGQETTTPYPVKHGRTLQEAAEAIAARTEVAPATAKTRRPVGRSPERSLWLGGGRWTRRLFHRDPDEDEASTGRPLVVAIGPVGLVYLERVIPEGDADRFARALVAEAGCPLVLAPAGAGHARAYSRHGEFLLPRDAREVLGADHPFLDEVARDLVVHCHHPDAGDLMVCGWDRDGESVAFPMQNGAHAGPGPEETRAFVMTPSDAPLLVSSRGYVRPAELRAAALAHLGRAPRPTGTRAPKTALAEPVLRVMTYNVHGCVGMDGRLSPDRIARVIAQAHVDVAALQELDVSRARSGRVDQAHEIARRLEMRYHFHPTWTIEEEQYGDAVLSRLPMRLVRAAALPSPEGKRREPRGAVWVEVDFQGAAVQIINTHLGVMRVEQRCALEALLGDEWLAAATRRGPTILCGDFNFGPTSRLYGRVRSRLVDAQAALDEHTALPTWFSWRPVTRIDHVFTTPDLSVTAVQTPRSKISSMASDHLPLVVDVTLAVQPSEEPQTAAASVPGV